MYVLQVRRAHRDGIARQDGPDLGRGQGITSRHAGWALGPPLLRRVLSFLVSRRDGKPGLEGQGNS